MIDLISFYFKTWYYSTFNLYNTLNTRHSVFECVNDMPKHSVNHGKLKPFNIEKDDIK